MADIFDRVSSNKGGDIFDQIAPIEPQKPEGFYEGFVKPTMKAIPKVAGATAGSLLAFPVSGVAGLARLISTGDLGEAQKTIEGVQSVPGKMIDTPEEAAGMENIGLAMKPFEWAREAGQYVGRKTGIPYAEPTLGTLAEAGAMFGIPGALKRGAKIADFRSLERPLEPTLEIPTRRTLPVEREAKPLPVSKEPAQELVATKDIFDMLERQNADIAAQESQRIKGILESLKVVEDQGQGKFKDIKGQEAYPEEIRMPDIDQEAVKIKTFFDDLLKRVDQSAMTDDAKVKLQDAIEADRQAHIEAIGRMSEEIRLSGEGIPASEQSEPTPAIIPPVTKKPGTANIPAKEKPLAEAEQLFPETNRLTVLDKNGASWNRIRNENPAITDKSNEVIVYRATVGDSIRPGDFVAANKSISTQHLENLKDRGEKGKLISQKVSIDDLLMGNDATEFQYFPKTETTPKAVSGSKVTHRVYHYSDKLIEDYEPGYSQVPGFFVSSPSKKYANKFGEVRNEAFLEIHKPLDLRKHATGIPGKGHTYKEWLDIFDKNKIDTSKLELDNDLFYKEGADDGIFYWSFLDHDKGIVGENNNFLSLLKEAGYDGIVAKEEGKTVWIPFEKSQIKSLPNPSRPPEAGGQSIAPKGEIGGVIEEKPPAPKQGTLLYSGIDPTQTLKVLKELSGKIGETLPARAAGQLIDRYRDPAYVSKEPAWQAIYKTADKADIEQSNFLAKQGREFESAVKVKPETTESSKIGLALDGQISPETLSATERKSYDFFKTKYHFLLQEAAKSAAGTPEVYQKALNLARGKKPIVMVKELTEGQAQYYKGLKTPNERIEYLHQKWIENNPKELVNAYNLLSRERENYLPHIFDDRNPANGEPGPMLTALMDEFRREIGEINNKLRTATAPGAITQYKNRLRLLEDSLVQLEGGKFISWKQLPSNVYFKFFAQRKGKEGFSFDAVKAYQTYLVGIAKKIYTEPALKIMGEEFKNLSPDMKKYADQYIRRFSGQTEKGPLDDFASVISSLQWMRTLGLNPRSALVNLSQRINTVAEIGPVYSAKGYKMAWTPEGKALFDKTGIAEEIPQVLYEGGATKFEEARRITGYMFNKMEEGNRKHAFLSGYLKAKEKLGMSEADAVQYGIDMTHKTQFRYGRVGMPLALSTPLGRTAFQFSSYPIKQMELLNHWLRNDPKKLIAYIAMAEGVNYTLQEFLNTDMSNALGIGVTWGQAFDAIKDLTKGDMREAWRHTQLAIQPGTGMLPSGPGPTVTGIAKVISAIPEGRAGATLVKEITPVVGTRLKQAYEAVKEERGGKYPIKDTKGHPYVRLTGGELLQRTVGPRTATEERSWQAHQERTSLNKERTQIMRDIVNAIVDKDYKEARALMKQHRIIPTGQQIEAEIMRRRTTEEERLKMKTPGRLEEFRHMKGHTR